MERLKSLIQWISNLPLVGKILSLVCIMIAMIVIVFFCSSCGASKSTVRVYNRADSTTTTISVSNGDGGSTTVNVEPKINVDSTKIL